jgi:hypothetical protein
MAWINPYTAERRRAENRQRMRRLKAKRSGGRLGAGPPRSPEFKLERMRSLKARGMSYGGIAIAMSFDFPETPINARSSALRAQAGRGPARVSSRPMGFVRRRRVSKAIDFMFRWGSRWLVYYGRARGGNPGRVRRKR